MSEAIPMNRLLTAGNANRGVPLPNDDYSLGGADVYATCLSVGPRRADTFFPPKKAFESGVILWHHDLTALTDNSEATKLSKNAEKSVDDSVLFHRIDVGSLPSVMVVPTSCTAYGSLHQPISPSGSYTHMSDSDVVSVRDRWGTLLTTVLNRSRRFSAATQIQNDIEALGKLPQNWDSDGAHSIPSEVIVSAIDLLSVLADFDDVDLPSVGPMPDGRISFTLEADQRELWIYVDQSSYVSHQWEHAGQFESIVRKWSDANQVAEYLEWLRT